MQSSKTTRSCRPFRHHAVWYRKNDSLNLFEDFAAHIVTFENAMNIVRKFWEILRKSLVLLIYKIVELKIGLIEKLNGSHFNIEIILLLKLTVAENLSLIDNANIERLIRLSRIETGLNSFS